jgi:hypothetical protein
LPIFASFWGDDRKARKSRLFIEARTNNNHSKKREKEGKMGALRGLATTQCICSLDYCLVLVYN